MTLRLLYTECPQIRRLYTQPTRMCYIYVYMLYLSRVMSSCVDVRYCVVGGSMELFIIIVCHRRVCLKLLNYSSRSNVSTNHGRRSLVHYCRLSSSSNEREHTTIGTRLHYIMYIIIILYCRERARDRGLEIIYVRPSRNTLVVLVLPLSDGIFLFINQYYIVIIIFNIDIGTINPYTARVYKK